MKKFLLTLFGVLYVGLFTGGQAKAIEVDTGLYNTGSYKIKFSDYSGASSAANNAIESTALLGRIIEGAQHFPTYYGQGGFQYANIFNAGTENGGKNGLRFSVTNGTANGYLSYTVPEDSRVVASSIVIEASGFRTSAFIDATMSLSVNGKQVGNTVDIIKTDNLTNYEFQLDELTKLETVRIDAVKSFYLKSITVNYVIAKEPNKLSFPKAADATKIGETYAGLELNNPNNLPVTYTSSNTDVATVNASGVVTVKAKGSTIIKATFTGNNVYAAGSAEYALAVEAADDKPAGLSFEKGVVNMQYDVNYTGQTLANPNGLDVTYTSSNEAVATVDAQGKVTLVGIGSATIKAETAGGEKNGNSYGPGSAQYTVNVTKCEVTLSWSGKTSYNVGDAFEQPTLTVDPEQARGIVEFSTVSLFSVGENNALTLDTQKDGFGRVTASIDSKLYQATPATFTVRVSDPTMVEDVLTAEQLKSTSYKSTTSGITYSYKLSTPAGLIRIPRDESNGLWISGNDYGLVLSKIRFVYGGEKTTVNIKVRGEKQAMPNYSDYTTQSETPYITQDTSTEPEYVFVPAKGSDMQGVYILTTNNLNLQEVVFVYEKVQPAYGYDMTAYTIVKGVETFTQPTLKNLPEDEDFVVEYASDNALVTVDKNGANFKVNETVVNDDDEEGVTATVTVSNAENAIYKAHSASYTLTVKPKTAEPAGLSFGEKTEFDVTYGEAFTAPTLTQATTATAKYTSSNTDVAEVTADGVVTIKGAGNVMITAHVDAVKEGENKFFEGDAYYTINVNKAEVTLSWPADQSIILNSEYEAPEFTVATTESIEEEARQAVKLTATGLLSIADGKIVLAEGLDGYGTVTASIESDNFVSTSATYTLTVTDPTKIEDELLISKFSTSKQWTSANTGVAYAYDGSSDASGNFDLNSSNGMWISANKYGLEISKIILVYNSATTNNNYNTLYTSNNVEEEPSGYSNVAATFVKTANNLECEYRSAGNEKGFYLKPSSLTKVAKVIVQYSKITPSYKFVKDSYSVHYGDDSFVAPKVIDVPEGVTVTYSTEENDAAYFDEDGVLVLKEVVGDPKTATIVASNEAEGIYNAYQTSYILEVQEKLEDLGELAISVNNEDPEYNNDGEIEVIALEANVKVSVLNATKLVVKVDDETKYDGPNSYFEWSVDDLGKYTVSVTATAPNGEDTTFDAFTINAIPNPDSALGEGFEINEYIIDAESSVLVNVGQKVTISIANATEFTVDGISAENGVYYYYPTKVSVEGNPTIVKLYAKDVYGQELEVDAKLLVEIPLTETLDFTQDDYGMTRFAEGSDYNGDGQKLTGTSFTYTVNSSTRLWQNTGLRFNYRGVAGEMMITAPEGYAIKSVETLSAGGEQVNYDNLTITIASNRLSAAIEFNKQTGNGTSLPAVKVEISEIPVADSLTPDPESDIIQGVKNPDGSYTIIMSHESLKEVYIYYKQTLTFERKAPRRVVGENGETAYDDDFASGYQRAETEGDGTHILTVPQAGAVRYYAYHPASATVGNLQKLIVESSGNVTGIEEVEAEGEDAGEVYDLQGRRISKPTRGLYIQNGQKVLIRK